MLSIGTYLRAESPQEAYELLRAKRRARVLGGGAWLRLGTGSIPVAIDLSDCELDRIVVREDDSEFGAALRIGAYVTLRDLEISEDVARASDGLLRRAVRDIVGVQFRHIATVGGSVAGRFGFSDVCCALLALGADVEFVGAGRISMECFLADPHPLRDVLTHVVLPMGHVDAGYQAVRKQSTDLPVLNACAVFSDERGWRIAIGARPARARLIAGGASDAGFTERDLAEDDLDAITRAARSLTYSGNMWASAAYRECIASELVRRAIEEATQ